MKKITFIPIIILLISVMGTGLIGGELTPYEAYITTSYYLDLYAFDKAEKVIDQYLATHPDDPFLLTEKAYILANVRNKQKEALKTLEKSLEVYPQYYYANYLYASILFVSQTIDASIKKFNKSKDKTDNKNKDQDKEKDVPTYHDTAIEHLERAIKDNDQSYESFFLLGIILNEKGDYAKSNKYLKQAAKLKDTPEPLLYMVNNFTHLKDIAGQIDTYKEILKVNPHDYKTLSELAEYYLDQKAYKNAAFYLEKMFHENPEDNKRAIEYLFVLFANGESDKFLEVEQNVDVSKFPILIYAKALFLSEKEQYREAIELLKRIEKQDLKEKILLADIYRRKKDYYEGYRILEKIKKTERNQLFYSLFMDILSSLDLNRRVLDVFEEIKDNKKITDEFIESDHYSIIFAYANLNRVASLEKYLKSAIGSDENKSAHLIDLQNALMEIKKNPRIEAKEIKYDINRYIVAGFFKDQKKYEDAIYLLKGMIALKEKGSNMDVNTEAGKETNQKANNNPGPYLELCDIYMEQGNYQGVESLLEKLDKRFPKSNEVKNFSAYYLAMENKRLTEALDLSALTLATDSENLAYLDTYGFILFKTGRLDEAVTFLKKAYHKNPFEREVMEHLADYYRKKNNTVEIIKMYQLAIENGVDYKEQLEEKIKQINKNK